MNQINFSINSLKGDLYGGVTAAIVALPLALAFGVSSGAGPIAGIYGAIFVGFFAALFGGTNTQVSGPTGPMTVVMASIMTSAAASGVEYAFAVVIMGGGLQVLFGMLKFGRYIRLMPHSVISGFMSGIGIIIILLQLNQLVGHPPVTSPMDALLAMPTVFSMVNLTAIAIGLVSLGIVFFSPSRLNQLIPAPLIALIACTLLVVLALPENALPILGEIPSGLPKLKIPEFELTLLPEMIRNAVVLALLGSIDSLLTSLVADNATNTQHNSNRELIGQGIGNMAAGLFAGLPGAGATMRTMVNIKAGGVSRASGMIHALVLLVVVAGAGPLASQIPLAALAGILIKVGVDIIDWQSFRRISTTPYSDLAIMFTVMGLTVFVDLITAVFVGLVMASIILTNKLSELQLDHMNMGSNPDDLYHLPQEQIEFIRDNLDQLFYCRLRGPLSFAAARDMARIYQQLLSHESVLLDLSEAMSVDYSTVRTIEDIIQQTRQKNIPVAIYCPDLKIRNLLKHQIGASGQTSQLVFDERIKALQFLAVGVA